MNDGHLLIGYHGCDVTVRDGLISGKLKPAPSNNQYDWLGPGFYMFEGDEERALAGRRRDGHDGFQAVRGAFRQGPEVAPNSGFHRDSHIQIALRDPSCVRGWFLPAGAELLSHAEMTQARAALRALRDAYPKARRRVEVG